MPCEAAMSQGISSHNLSSFFFCQTCFLAHDEVNVKESFEVLTPLYSFLNDNKFNV